MKSRCCEDVFESGIKGVTITAESSRKHDKSKNQSVEMIKKGISSISKVRKQQNETDLDSKYQILENAEKKCKETQIQRNRKAHTVIENAEVMIEGSDTILRFDSS